MKRFLLFVILVALGLLGVSRWNQHRRAPESYTPANVAQLHLGETPALAALDAETTRLVQTVVPAVVSITTSRKVSAPQIVDPFEFFFGRRRGQPAPQQAIKNSLGSGVIVSREGHILTNFHVVANVDEVLVQLNDGRAPFPARLIGGDEATDIAVIKIDVKGLPCLPLGDSDTVKVGQLVFAVGNPFGLQETVTKGIISATGRVTDEYGIEYFQTEAVINPGNSGGPLINIRGEIIGINTAIGNYSGSGTWQGVGFAIPSNIVRRSLEGILKTGRVARGYLGVAIDPLTPELAEQFGLPGQTGGVVVRSITPGSPAQKAGLQPGDVLVAINGKPIQGARDLVRQIASAAVGSKVEIKVIRDKQEQTLTVTIEEQPAGFKIGPPQQQPRPQE
ncbi:MAG: trypsin-like peptidase domain-containing protein [Verrucomicrobiota bacterium]